MSYDKETLRRIFASTDGRCHICRKKLSFNNYGQVGRWGAWEVDHSKPKSKGGTDHLNNFLAACFSCNRQKGNFTARTARSWHGHSRVPLSKEKKLKAKKTTAFSGGAIGGGLGFAVIVLSRSLGYAFSPLCFLAATEGCAIIEAKIGYDKDPDKD